MAACRRVAAHRQTQPEHAPLSVRLVTTRHTLSLEEQTPSNVEPVRLKFTFKKDKGGVGVQRLTLRFKQPKF